MAITKLSAGKRIGKVGNERYSFVKGQNIVASQPISVANPKTTKQMTQRSKFLMGVKFFQAANQALFKMAFEDRRTVESDYNAFMRHNSKDCFILPATLKDDMKFPKVGNYQVTQGSLPSADVTVEADQPILNLAGNEAEISTIGELSAALIGAYGLKEGDIVTTLYINTALKSISGITPSYQGDFAPIWNIKQFRINQSSTDEIATVGMSVESGETEKVKFGELNSTTVSGCTVVFSRLASTGLLVSTARIVGNSKHNAVVNVMKTDTYQNAAIATWNPGTDAILAGAYSEGDATPGAVVEKTIILSKHSASSSLMGFKVNDVQVGDGTLSTPYTYKAEKGSILKLSTVSVEEEVKWTASGSTLYQDAEATIPATTTYRSPVIYLKVSNNTSVEVYKG